MQTVAEGHRAVSVLYQALLTGLVLTLVTRRSEDEALISSSGTSADSTSRSSCPASRSSA